jgi:hypothetical protein
MENLNISLGRYLNKQTKRVFCPLRDKCSLHDRSICARNVRYFEVQEVSSSQKGLRNYCRSEPVTAPDKQMSNDCIWNKQEVFMNKGKTERSHL